MLKADALPSLRVLVRLSRQRLGQEVYAKRL